MVQSVTSHPVPRSVADWIRHTKSKPTLNDLIERLHLQLLSDESYARLFDAVYNSQAIEGSLASDDHAAAYMLRAAAMKEGSPVSREKLATIIKALHVVLRRYEMSRAERRTRFTGTPRQDSELENAAE